VGQYLIHNWLIFMLGGAVAIIPILAYFLIRTVRGWYYASMGRMLIYPRAWF
jgi:hypothetical protein